MIRVFYITSKDMLQMPARPQDLHVLAHHADRFHAAVGYAFGGFGGGSSDPIACRWAVDQTESWLSRETARPSDHLGCHPGGGVLAQPGQADSKPRWPMRSWQQRSSSRRVTDTRCWMASPQS